MGISVRASRTTRGNWVVIDHHNYWAHRALIIRNGRPATRFTSLRAVIRTYTCTNWTDAMRIADDLANERTIDPWRVIALSERRV